MGKNYFMGIDIGTFESKGVITGSEGNVISSHSCPHIMESPKPGYAEHDAEKTWWGDFCRLSKGLLGNTGIDPKDIAAVGCSTIAPCCLPVDKDCKPLRKAILYGVDVRAGNEIAFIENYLGKDNIFKKYGQPVTSQSAAAKILWLKNNEPEIYEAAHKFITGTTYLVARLTGRYVIDKYTAAAWVPMYDIKSNDWDKETLNLFCRPERLADCKWTAEAAGTVTREAAAETGLAEGTPVTAGTADAAAEAVSAGVFEPGDMLLMYGSSVFIIHVTDRFATDRRLWSGPYLFPGTYSVTAGMSTTGTLTRWFRDNFARELVENEKSEGTNAYDLLAAEAANIPAGSEGLLVLPYFSGERTPINDPLAKGVIFGLNLLHTRAHIYNACLEGVGYGISQHFDIFDGNGLGTKKVMAVGGGTKNEKWLQIVSDISGKAQFTAEEAIGASYGDALLAALSVGFYKDTGEIAKIIKHKKAILPNSDNIKRYSFSKQKYRELYQITKDLMHKLPAGQ
jgi:xylulokinase